MKRKVIICIWTAIIACMALTAVNSWAITLSVSPNPVMSKQNVSINATASFVATPCPLNINFGDGTPAYIQNCVTTPCTASTAHIYSSPGTFTITASAGCGATPPNPVSTILFVQCAPLIITSPAALPSGTVGQAYTYQLLAQVPAIQAPVSFSLVAGSLPPGVQLSSAGLITGTPASGGVYTFTVRATDSCGAGIQTSEKTHTIQIPQPPLNVVPVPPSIRIARGQSSAYNVGYQFRGVPSYSASLTSSAGNFMHGGQIIETNPVPLIVTVQNGAGLVSDAVNVPVRVIERVLQGNTNTFTYSRTFSDSQTSVTATVFFTITTEAGAEFELKRIELFFDNRRPEITITRNFPKLKAFAAIRFTGSGLLQGYWEVDGRLLSTVNQHLVYAKDVVLETPAIPSLPTFEPGSHIVRFVVTVPATAISLPSIVYFVTPEETEPLSARILLISPGYEDKLAYAPATFRWEPLARSDVYLVQYFEGRDSQPIFSAYAKESSYTLPKALFNNVFSPGRAYYWKVTGFNHENNIKGESELRPFTFREPPDHVQGQIIAVFSETAFSDVLLNELKDKFSLTLSDNFLLKALHLRAVIFETKEDIYPIMDALGKDGRITIAQPNFIFRTLSDPKRRMQYANDIMQIDRIHESLTGRGIIVAVLDTGIEQDHQDLKETVLHAENFVKGGDYVPEIHGTAVAGIIAAGLNGVGIEGVAPDARILAMRVCVQLSDELPQGECHSDSIAKALDKAIGQKSHIVNMSFGTTRYDNLIAKLLEKGASQGILFVAPSGNLTHENSLRFPASHPSVISVGGVDEQMKPYPNTGITLQTSVNAPAVNILTTVPVNKYNFMHGTSMSAAYISGVLAAAREKHPGFTKDTLPAFKGDICAWEEKLLHLSLCGK